MRLQDWLLLACVQGLSLQGVRIFPLWREKVKWMNATSPKYEEVTSWVNKASPSSRCPSLVSSFSQQTMEQHENKLYLHIFLEKKKKNFLFCFKLSYFFSSRRSFFTKVRSASDMLWSCHFKDSYPFSDKSHDVEKHKDHAHVIFS